MPKTFAIVSLGCFRNLYDSELVGERFAKEGLRLVPPDRFSQMIRENEPLDTLIINTCGFIKEAKKESLEAIREAVALKNKAQIKRLYVFGCLVKRYPAKLKKFFPQVDSWWGPQEFSLHFLKRKKLTPSHIDFLKISEGCINNCSYCAIPLIKGNLRSKPLKEILKEVRFLEQKGIKELNIIGQDITSWGKDLGENTFRELLKAILKNTRDIAWIRLLYTHPRHFSQDLIELIAQEKRICKYIDLPIQHINDRILTLMARQITKKEIIQLIEKIRKKIPEVVLRTSIIVGFPTESEREFKELLNFLRQIKFERLGAFIYSREENTPAYSFKPQVPFLEKKRRFQELMRLQKEIAFEVNQRFVGRTLEVLVEKKEREFFLARSPYDAYEIDGVVFLKKKGLKVGEFYKAKIKEACGYDLIGQ